MKGTPPTSSAVFNHSEQSSHCVYCEQTHLSSSCTVVTEVTAKIEVLRRSGRCYICLKKRHISRDCRSKTNCGNCRGCHHTTICPHTSHRLNDTYTIPLGTQSSSNQISTTQPIDLSRNHYDHLRGLDLADSADVRDTLKIDLLIGFDVYWSLATGRVIKGRSGPLAI